MPATLPVNKRPQAKKKAARLAPPRPKAKAAVATTRPRRFSGKLMLSDKDADFFNAFLG